MSTDIIDLSDISPQRTFLESYPNKPDSKSSLYINKAYTSNADGSQNHTIIGFHIVLKKGDPNQLWEILNTDRKDNKQDAQNPKIKIQNLEIYCDTLEVHGKFAVPETNLTLYARRLIWSTAEASINTSPLDWAVVKAKNADGLNPGKNGAHGRNAGALNLFVRKVESLTDSSIRLLARGGQGQDPGAGLDGKDGETRRSYASLNTSININLIFGKVENRANINFDPPAIYYEYYWSWIGIPGTAGTQSAGNDSFPTSGTDAFAPGKPGNGGNGGSLTTNDDSLLPLFNNQAGEAGTKERDYHGGSAGQPVTSAKYKVQIHEDITGTQDASYDLNKIGASHTTTSGNGANAEAAAIAIGKKPEAELISPANVWLHPLQLQTVLEYARDLFLAGARNELKDILTAYEEALSQIMPENKVWNNSSSMHWTRAASEIAVIQQRLRDHLDYFGNGAGYTPFLSLQGTIKLYDEETKRAFQMLLLVNWINSKERSVKELSNILSESVDKLNEDIHKSAEKIISSESRIAEYRSQMDALKQELNGLSNELAELENVLISKARADLQLKATIKAGIKMAAALCQVIPVGQPVLGTLGSLASVATDFIGDDGSGTPDTISKLGDVFDKAHSAAGKAEDTRMKVKQFRDKFDDEKDPSPGKEMLHKAGAGLGPALSQVSQGLKALQVPESEVEAELMRLESESEEWNKLTNDIRDLNKRKVAVLTNLMEALHAVGEGYARISSSSIAVMNMQQAKTKELSKLDFEATACVNEMGQHSKTTLIYYLYLMVKAYETTVLSPIDVNWKLSAITDKINELLKSDDEFTSEKLASHVEALEPLYKNNIDKIRSQLLTEFNFNESTKTLQIGLSKKQTPALINNLNETGVIHLNPVFLGLILPDQQLARISDAELTKIDFDSEGPSLPDNHNMIISLQPENNGTLRKSEALYAVYSDEPIRWSWSYISSAKDEANKIKKSERSKGAEDMLNFILGDSNNTLKQKMSYPPVWSNLRLKVQYSPSFTEENRPKITRLYLTLKCDSSSAPEHQRVLNVQQLGSPAIAEVNCSLDLADRSNGLNNIYRIFSKGSKIKLGVPEFSGGSAFDNWRLVGRQINRVGEKKPEVDFKVDDHVIAQSNWSPTHQESSEVVLSNEDLVMLTKKHKSEKIRTIAKKRLAAAPAAKDLIIRIEPDSNSTVVGVISSLYDAELIKEGDYGWELINYCGVIGWVNGAT